MPQIIDNGTANTVVVERVRNVSATVRSVSTVQVASPGPQGTPGAAGGTYETRTASETLGGHRIVRSTGADTVGYASSDNPDHGDDTQGMTMGAATSGATVNVQRVGSVTHSGWAWTPGEPVFLGTNGLPTQTPPSDGFVQVIGHAEAADTLFLSIEPPIYF